MDWIFRTDSLGVPDTTFHTGVYTGQAFCYVPLADGRIYVGGSFVTDQAPGDTLHLARFLADGTLDPTFSSLEFLAGGGLSTPFGAAVHDLVPWKNGTLLVAGQFLEVDGQVRKGLCLVDSTGQLLGAFDQCGVGPFNDGWLTNAATVDLLITPDSTAIYICGAYVGYNDGTINDTQQRFVSRLLVEEVNVGTDVTLSPPKGMQVDLRLHPNPANGNVSVNYGAPSSDALWILVKDVQGNELRRWQLSGAVGTTVMDTRALAPGVYFVELVTSGTPLRTERLVVQP